MPHLQFKRPSVNSRYGRRKSGGFSKGPILKWALVLFAFLFLIGGISFFSLLAWTAKDLPNPDQIIEREVAQTTKIFDRTGEHLLYEIHGNQKRTVLALDEIPEYVKWATLTAEDRNFYNHKGFTIIGMARAAIVNFLSGTKSQGGSTITQQLVKNAILTSEKTYTRKFKELILAYQIENKFSKDQILKMYLNEIPYGSTAYGIQAAAETFFGKNAKELTLAESAIVAAIPKATTYYSPYGNHKDELFARQNYILDSMHELGYISEEELHEAKNQELVFQRKSEDIVAPHFVMYIKQQLAETYGEKEVELGGLSVITTLDMEAQMAAEEAIAEFADYNAENYDASNAALVAIDPKTGQVLAMVGSKDYFNEEIDGQYNVAVSPRQPGSSFKPLVYTVGFDKGYTDNTVVFDVETTFEGGDDDYHPRNYDLQESGPISLRKALAGSKNIPAVKMTYLVGVHNVLDYAEKLGYTTLSDRSRYGLSLVLGGGEVKLLEHVAAFGAFSQDGRYHQYASVLEVRDHKGKVLERYKDQSTQVFKTQSARLITDILSDNDARAYAFGQHNRLTLPDRPVAAKTGTTNDYRDGWTVGYTPSVVAGVWAGNNDNSEMRRAGGSKVAAPIWQTFMKKYLEGKEVEYFKQPGNTHKGKAIIDGEGGLKETLIIDKITKKLATEYTPEHLREEKTFQTMHNILHYVDKNNPLGPEPSNPANDNQYQAWEDAVLAYLEKEEISTDIAPTEEDDVHLPENTPSITITSPSQNTTIDSNTISASVSASSKRGVQYVDYFIDDILIRRVSGSPFSLIAAPLPGIENGSHILKAVAYDDVENLKETQIQINIQTSLSPSIRVTSPQNNAEFMVEDFPVTMDVLAFPGSNDKYQGIKQVTFQFTNGQYISSFTYPNSSKLSATIESIPGVGNYALQAKMETELGDILESPPIQFTVLEPVEEEQEEAED